MTSGWLMLPLLAISASRLHLADAYAADWTGHGAGASSEFAYLHPKKETHSLPETLSEGDSERLSGRHLHRRQCPTCNRPGRNTKAANAVPPSTAPQNSIAPSLFTLHRQY